MIKNNIKLWRALLYNIMNYLIDQKIEFSLLNFDPSLDFSKMTFLNLRNRPKNGCIFYYYRPNKKYYQYDKIANIWSDISYLYNWHEIIQTNKMQYPSWYSSCWFGIIRNYICYIFYDYDDDCGNGYK